MTASITTINAARFKGTVFFSLTLRRKFGNRGKVNDAAKLAEYLVAKKAAEASATNNAVQMDGACKATKQLVVSEPLDTLNEYMNGVKDKLVGRFGMANPSMIKAGLFTVSETLVQQFEDDLAKASKKLDEEFTPAFLADYPQAIERARTLPVAAGGLGPLFKESDYPAPGKLNDAFGFEWQWLALSVPEGLPEGLKQAAQQKLEKQLSDAADEIQTALRESFRDLITHATDKLTSAPGEKPRVFRDSLIGNIQAFIDSFNARNVMNDAELGQLVEQAKKLLGGGNLTANKLRQFASVRDVARKQFEEIKTALDGMIETGSERRFDFSQD